ncbi:hypothetical protein C2S53_000106 [Perilla frutescens var. hirtella]|uniref:Uncharacterized protein n=1 Tax=Perilla frutescens var. hirtella TaxID=608512 RepID=A0AAD4IZK9_PERFH|nr:hypothetical protein C2S53_000106 [Perilla frutescens var. hirtella]
MENGREDLYPCPSFNSYLSDKLAEIAVQVVAERNEDDEDFELSLVCEAKEFSAEEFIYDGQLGLIFPVFNRDLLLSDNDGLGGAGGNERFASSIQVPLSKLFIEDRDGDNPPSLFSQPG